MDVYVKGSKTVSGEKSKWPLLPVFVIVLLPLLCVRFKPVIGYKS